MGWNGIPRVPYHRRLGNKELDSFCRLLYASMRNNTMEEYIDKLQYVFKKTIAEKMRKQGFKFRPVLRQNKYGPSLNKCDYELEVVVVDKKIRVEVVIKNNK